MDTTRLVRQLFWAFGWSVLTLTIVPFCRLRTRGRANIPRRGPVLILANHTTLFDVLLIYWSSFRRVHGLGSDDFLKEPIIGPLMTRFSVIPFTKGASDREALTELNRRIDRGAAVLIFPEGDRSWTGHFQPVKNTNGRLAKRLGCPVVCCRVDTGHLHWPRWADYPRFMPVHLEYLPPRTYTQDLSDAEVTADIVRQITIDPHAIEVPRWSFGFRLAWGLPDLLWACPACHSLGGLSLVPGEGDLVVCPSCEARWRVDLACRMNAEGGPAADTTVDHAWQGMLAHFGELPVVDAARFHEDGLALEGDEAVLSRVERGTQAPEPVGRGRIQLFADRLVLHDAERPLTIRLEEVSRVLMQLGHKVQLRLEGITYQLHVEGQSAEMWKHFLKRHHAATLAATHPKAP